MIRLKFLALAVCALIGCGDAASQPQGHATPTSPVDTLDLGDLQGGLLTLGDDEASPEGDGAYLFTLVRDARFLPDGRIAVLDQSPPFVRVFRVNGALEGAFLERGDGPGEGRRPGSIAIHQGPEGADELLILDQDAYVTRLGLDGTYLDRHRPVESGLRAAVPACEGERWFLYTNITSEVVVMLYSPAEDEIEHRWPLQARPGPYLGRHPPFVQPDDRGVVFFHERGVPPAILRWNCGAEEPVVLMGGITEEGFPRFVDSRPEESGPGIRLRMGLGEPPFPAGLANTDGGYVWFEWQDLPTVPGYDAYTAVYREDHHHRPDLILKGRWVLHDYRAEFGFLLSSVPPGVTPGVIVVPAERILRPR